MHTYRCTMLNDKGWTFDHIVGNGTNEQPYERAVREVNSNPEHAKNGPWVVYQTERHS